MKAKKVVYGTSDSLMNFAEAWLVQVVSKEIGFSPAFFYYPRGSVWKESERGLFEPYDYEPPSDVSDALAEAGLSKEIEVIPLQTMLSHPLADLTLREVVEIIRPFRAPEYQSFIVINLPEGNRIRASSKDKYYAHFAQRTIGDLLNDPNLKLGGTIIYFIYGNFLAQKNSEVYGILPRKIKDDVIGAFRAGQIFAGRKARVVPTGEFDFMTWDQWLRYYQDHKWRKVPAEVMKRFVNSEWAPLVCEKLFKGEYCPLAYKKEEDKFFFVEG